MECYYNLVLDALKKASSQNTELLKVAEGQLKSWETENGFYTTLMAIACDKFLDINIRWLAVLCLKNGLDRYWRRCTGSITFDEKTILKQRLLTIFAEPVNQIAVQFAVIIAKIARYDCPKEWAELFPALLNLANSPGDLTQQRALLTMHHVVKQLATKRLTGDRKMYQQLTANIFGNLLHQWVSYSSKFLQEVSSHHANSKISLEKALLTVKILKKLVLHGYKDPGKNAEAVNFLSLIFQQIKPFVQCRQYIKDQDSVLEMCEKYSVVLVKLLRDVVDIHPFSYVQFIRPTLECCVSFCFTKEMEEYLFEKLTVRFLSLIKAVLVCQDYKLAKLPEDTKNAMTIEAHQIKSEFFTYPVLREICDQIVSRYFLLTENDIKHWENCPEEFASDEGVECWKYSLRPCTEVLFLSIFHEFRAILTPLVIEMVKNIQSADSRDFTHILKKEAVYNAIGLAAFDLYDEINFDQWFTDVLIPELRIKGNNRCYIIRRRVICLIGQWVGVKMSPELRPLLYEIIIQLLSSEEDLLVRLAASNTLRIAIDDFEFSTEQFLPFLEASITGLYYLLREVREGDLKMSVLHVLSFIVERMGCQVRPYAASVMQYLPQLWDSCGEHNMLRCAIISCFVNLVRGLGTLSEKLQPFLLSMIAFSTDVDEPPHVYLLEDGLELWWSVLDNSSVCSPELLNLGRYLVPLLECNSENLRVCLQITQGYILLSPHGFLEKYGSSIVKTFTYIITDMKPEGISNMLRVIENAFIVFPEEGPVLFQPVLSKVLSLCLKDEDLPVLMSAYFSVLSRVILHNQNCFVSLLQEQANETHKTIGDVLSCLLDLWLEKMPLINPAEKRKLSGLALTCLLTTGSDIVYERICGVFLAVVEVLNDITKFDSSISPDSLVLKPEDFSLQDEDEETENDRRIKELSKQDPVHTVVLRDYLYSQVCSLQNSVGVSKFEDLMGTVDIETMQQLQQYLQC